MSPVDSAVDLRALLDSIQEFIVAKDGQGRWLFVNRIVLEAYAMVGFGGAGPMISCFVAASLGINHVIIPSTPGVLSALGGLVTDLKNDFIRTTYVDLNADALPLIREAVAELTASGETWLRDGQGYTGKMGVLLSGEMRYRGQSFEIDTPLDPAWIETGDLAACASAFHGHHARLFGHSDPEAPVQLVSLRLQAIGERPRPELARIANGAGSVEPQRLVKVWLDGKEIEIPLYIRSSLFAGDRFDGPAIVAQPDTTTAIPPGFSVDVDEFGTMHIKTSGDSQ